MTPWAAAHQASLSITNSQSLLRLMSLKSVMPSNHLILCRPLHLSPSISPSNRVFSSESVLRIRWTKYWGFSISPSNEYSGLISFRIDWFDLLAVQGTLKSLQHHGFKSISSSLFSFRGTSNSTGMGQNIRPPPGGSHCPSQFRMGSEFQEIHGQGCPWVVERETFGTGSSGQADCVGSL